MISSILLYQYVKQCSFYANPRVVQYQIILCENDRLLRGKGNYESGRPRWLFQKSPARIRRINSREIPVPLEDDFTEWQTIWEIFLNVYRADNILEPLPYHA
jgi:hypothetical protein